MTRIFPSYASLFFIIMAALIITGCSAKRQMYYYGNYAETLYHYKKTPTDETMARHREEILHIITISKEKNQRVPPGICAEYAHDLMKEGNFEEAGKYLEMEEKAYPESKKFVNFLRNSLKEEGK